MEAALRTVHHEVTGEELGEIEIQAVRGFENVREAALDLGGDLGRVKVAVVHGLKGVRQMAEAVSRGDADYHFIEMMSCPGGCMGGGGQPRAKKAYQTAWRERREALYGMDRESGFRQSHNNPMIKMLYEQFLKAPLSHKSHELLHTAYHDRTLSVRHTMKEIWEEIHDRRAGVLR